MWMAWQNQRIEPSNAGHTWWKHSVISYIPSLVSWGVASCACHPSCPAGRSGRLNHDSFHTWKFLKIHKIEQDTRYLICACFQVNQNKASLVNIVLRILLHNGHRLTAHLCELRENCFGKSHSSRGLLAQPPKFSLNCYLLECQVRRTSLIYCVIKKNHICLYEVRVKWYMLLFYNGYVYRPS